MEVMLVICILLLIIVIVADIFLVLKIKKLDTNSSNEQLETVLKEYINQENSNNRIELNAIISNLVTTMSENITNTQSTLDTQRNSQLDSMDKSLENIRKTMYEQLEGFSEKNERKTAEMRDTVGKQLELIRSDNNSQLTAVDKSLESIRKTMYEQLESFSEKNERKIAEMRDTVEKQLEMIRSDNNAKLESMRETVNEKLQKTLDEKLSNSFSLVTQKLEQVYKELGEMQNLATGVGDLKKVLSNVKTRGILGEIQLGAILKEILSPEQYDENVVTVSGTRNPVEFAVKLPNDNNSFVYLPIDSKFPADTYQHLLDAQDSGDKTAVDIAVKQLIATLKSEAKDIHEKYISPPQTTDFGIMFLPCEGLYAEAVNRGLVEILQKSYKINIAGPSTMAALLNSLQMGFKTLAVQKRSVEVWNILNSVKEEFDKFNDVLEATQNRINQANKELDKLVGVRTRQIQRSLSKITEKQNLS